MTVPENELAAFVPVLAVLVTLAVVIAWYQTTHPRKTWGQGRDDWHADMDALRAATAGEDDPPLILMKGTRDD